MGGKQKWKSIGIKSLLISFSILIIAVQCDEKPFVAEEVTFVLPISVEPSDSIITIGDTLWIEANFEDSLYDFQSKKKYKVTNFDFGQTSIVVRRLLGNTTNLGDQASGGLDFTIIDENNAVTFPGETLNFIMRKAQGFID